MTCGAVQQNLSLYLYGELEFALEEEIEQHLAECAVCQEALVRETAWHQSANAGCGTVPLALLSQCRWELKQAIALTPEPLKTRSLRWFESMGLAPSRWSLQLAMASLLVCVGFGAARVADRLNIDALNTDVAEAAQTDPAFSRIRDISTAGGDQVRIVVDQIRRRIVYGRAGEQRIRQLLLAGARDSEDSGMRVDLMDVLKYQSGTDVKDALLYAAAHDPDAGVRIKALDGLEQFAGDPSVTPTLTWILSHDRDPGVRSGVIRLLTPGTAGSHFDPRVVGALQEMVHSEPNTTVRLHCMRALHEMNASATAY